MRLNMESKTTSVLNRESRHGIMGEQVMVMVHDHHRHRHRHCHHSSSCRQVVCDEEVKSCYDDDSSPSSSSRTTSSSSSSSSSPLQDMSSLLQQLPLKRGLSKHYNGKSQSFTSLSNVRSLEDLRKHDQIEINPHNKKLKTCKSYGAASTTSFPRNNTTCSSLITAAKNPPIKGSSFSSLVIGGSSNSTFLANNNNNNNNNSNNRPPIPHPPHRSTSIISA
ncbi:UNVERIFIED_CONTAM: hypothetical protein Slati_0136200 [Sesamum latifolium]|uniref:Uncharacterized protein n=1 Tax=Sesamum latifolium TaxID=2727402 RepID=A0AAW2YA21_9LAMI